MCRFLIPTQEHVELIYNWRKSEHVTRFMVTDLSGDLESHRAWFRRRVEEREAPEFWLIWRGEVPIGVIHIDDEASTSEELAWGFYIANIEYRGLGGFVLPLFYNFVFFQRQPTVNKVLANVLAENEQIIKLHKLHGYKELIGRRKRITKSDGVHEMIMLELTRDRWSELASRFGKSSAYFQRTGKDPSLSSKRPARRNLCS